MWSGRRRIERPGAGLDGRLQLVEERGIGLGIEERLPGRIERGDAALGDQDA